MPQLISRGLCCLLDSEAERQAYDSFPTAPAASSCATVRLLSSSKSRGQHLSIYTHRTDTYRPCMHHQHVLITNMEIVMGITQTLKHACMHVCREGKREKEKQRDTGLLILIHPPLLLSPTTHPPHNPTVFPCT